MKVLLVKCHKKTIFSKIEPIITEPLELEYLATILNKDRINYRIYDQLLEGKSFHEVFHEYLPDVLILTGYITAVEVIIAHSRYAKDKNPKVKVVVGGVHAEVNYQDFFADTIDFIVHSDGLNGLQQLLNINFDLEQAVMIKGIAFKKKDQWQVNEKRVTNTAEIPLPDRSYFNKYKHRTKYMNYSPLAIVKTALSCPYQCNFCYCKMLNQGIYSTRSIEAVVEEIEKIDAPYVWIVDDSFLLDRNRILQFIGMVKLKEVKKKYIVYSRVDFVANNEDLIEKLASIGVIEVIVGMEAVEDCQLENFNKNASAYENIRTVEILKKHNITLTALFIAGINFTSSDFRNMRRWIKEMALESYTVSIFTPIKGTSQYKDYEEKIQVKDYHKIDFLHLTLKPEKISKLRFYMEFYYIYVEQFFRSKYIRRFVLKNIKEMFKGGGHLE
ncbi:B12-binding domain-containing radical SAM protein [Alkaliphilus transvaalensis]|uniref:B12-binding domain-containing radical SAM protein n=1 Tax=Alkaliphilus transvaalensis TaxID=114628 RepID=UPI000688E52D|nr:B12-binding domain-containing radical SAM protein [Alkaliphilus transvaalensis]